MQRKCLKCRRHEVPSGVSQCFRCSLLTGPSLSLAFASIITRPDMAKFDSEMNEWYPVVES